MNDSTVEERINRWTSAMTAWEADREKWLAQKTKDRKISAAIWLLVGLGVGLILSWIA